MFETVTAGTVLPCCVWAGSGQGLAPSSAFSPWSKSSGGPRGCTTVDAVSLEQAMASGLRDPNDVPILAMTIASRADWLITGDKDLLALSEHFPILTPADFCTRHGL